MSPPVSPQVSPQVSPPKPKWPFVAAAVAAVVVLSAAPLAGYLVVRDDRPPAAALKVGGPTDTVAREVEPVETTGLTPAQASAIKTLKAQVAEIRGLAWKSELPVQIVTKADLARRVRDLTAKERVEHADDVADAEALLKLVGLFPPNLGLAATIDDLLSDNVLGFYDDETKDLFVGGDPGQPLSVATKAVVVHELVHALTDQHFDFGARGRALDDAEQTEESMALTALVEGDAEVTAAVWAQAHLNESQRRRVAENAQGSDPDTLEKVPPYLLNSLYFPYLEGSQFVTSLVRSGGFAAVDDAYRQPPISTEQIIHPESYNAGPKPAPPQLPDLSTLPGCELRTTGSIGEFDMTELLDLHLAAAAARRAAAGWNGDAFALVSCGSVPGLVDRWAGDTPTDVDELIAALSRWAAAWTGGTGPDADGRFSGQGRVGRLSRVDGNVELVLAADQPTADRLAAALAQGPPVSPVNPPA